MNNNFLLDHETTAAAINPADPKAKKASSQRRIEASRANGKKSRGPVTDAGKARSSQNASKHNLLATRICLTPEDEEVYCEIFDNYALRFQPRDQAEHDLLEELVFYKFQLRQCWMKQAAAIGMQIEKDRRVVDSEWAAPSQTDREVIALENSAKESNVITLLQRYASTLSTRAERAMKQLVDLQKLRIPPAPAAPELAPDHCPPTNDCPNDPNPEIEHSPETPLTTAVHPYTTPSIRVPRAYFGQPQSNSVTSTAPLARAA